MILSGWQVRFSYLCPGFHFSCFVPVCLSYRRCWFGFPGWVDGHFRGGWRGVAKWGWAWHKPAHHHYQQQHHHVKSGSQGYEEVPSWWTQQQGQRQGDQFSNICPGRQWERGAVCQTADTHFQPVGAQGRSSHQPHSYSQCCFLPLLWASGEQ